MYTNEFVPQSLAQASVELRRALKTPLTTMPREGFLKAWCGAAYLLPGLHPDSFQEDEASWPRALRPLAAEACRRADEGELDSDALYPSDAQWAGIYDRMTTHLPDETERRELLAAASRVMLDRTR